MEHKYKNYFNYFLNFTNSMHLIELTRRTTSSRTGQLKSKIKNRGVASSN